MPTSPAAVLREFLETVWNGRDLGAFPRLVSPDVRFHPPRGGPRAYAQYLAMTTDFQAAFPDLRFAIDRIVAEGDVAAAQLVLTGTHRGPFRGHDATGRPMRVVGRPWARVVDGRIVEFWQLYDELGMLHQLGLVDPSLA